jgi:hypothetical protein
VFSIAKNTHFVRKYSVLAARLLVMVVDQEHAQSAHQSRFVSSPTRTYAARRPGVQIINGAVDHVDNQILRAANPDRR